VDRRGAELIGTVLERRYRVDALLARGGMSAVYRGVDTRLDRPVAIKVMDSRFSGDRNFTDRFVREARATARLHHPGIVAVHDQGVDHRPDGDHVFLVMELVEGGTLRDLLQERGRLPVPVALSVLEQVLSALAVAHRHGLVHRDVKPENMLISRGGAVKVADFGLVRAVAEAGTTSDSVILGTVAYLSPEQVATGAADARSDVYSAGIVLYEMLTGAPPYTGDTALSIAYRHVNNDVPAPSTVVPELPTALDELVVSATRRDPTQRPADAAAFLMALQRVRSALRIPRVQVPAPAPRRPEPTPEAGQERPSPADVEEAPTETRIDPSATEPPTERIGAADIDGPTARFTPVSGPEQEGKTNPPHRRPGPIGPQGTRALSRAELGMVPVPGPPSATPSEPEPPAGASTYQQMRRRGRRTVVLWSVVVLLLAATIGVGAWWLGSGRWTSVPRVDGLDRTAAVQALQDADLAPKVVEQHNDTVPAGRIIRIEPEAGARVLRGSEVTLTVSKGHPKVPTVLEGTSLAEAEDLIRAAQLRPVHDGSTDEYHASVPKGTVIRLDPPAGTELTLDAPVTVVLSKGPPPTPVPDVRNMPRDQAFATLQQHGFEPNDAGAQFSDQVDGGKVITTNPAPGTLVDAEGSRRVDVVISNAVTVPDVTNTDLATAQQQLAALQLQVQPRGFNPGPGSRVVAQGTPPGTRVPPGSVIELFVFP